MHPDTREVASRMRTFGLVVLGRAAYDVTFSEMTRPFAHALAIGHAAHGAEIAIKARIAEEHPLLLFRNLPKRSAVADLLTLRELLETGRTIEFQDLPDALWAATGIRMVNADQFLTFGRLRNAIIHFAVPDADLPCQTLHFLFEVMEPLVQMFWNESIFHWTTEWYEETVAGGYLQEALRGCGVDITDAMKEAMKPYLHGT